MLLKQNTVYAEMDRVPSQQGRGTYKFKLFDSASTVLQNIPNYQSSYLVENHFFSVRVKFK